MENVHERVESNLKNISLFYLEYSISLDEFWFWMISISWTSEAFTVPNQTNDSSTDAIMMSRPRENPRKILETFSSVLIGDNVILS